MSHGFCRPALAVTLAHEYQPFDPRVILAPRSFGEFGRWFFHELLHCWQVLSQGYLTKLAAEEFTQLVQFRETGTVPELRGAEDLEGRMLARHPEIGFSAHQLTEALGRFWDVQVVGADVLYEASTGTPLPVTYLDDLPRDPRSGAPATTAEMFDLAMDVEDAYADPYRYAVERWGDQTWLVFPLAAHFSLQYEHPIDVFAEALGRRILLPDAPEHSLEPAWFRAWEPVRAVVAWTARALGSRSVRSRDVIAGSILSTHRAFGRLEPLFGLAEGEWGADGLEYAFSAPGAERGFLATFFHPSVTVLDGGRWLNAAPAERQLVEAMSPGLADRHLHHLANIGQSMAQTEAELRLAQLLARKARRLPAGGTARPEQVHLLDRPQLPSEYEMISGFELRDAAPPSATPPAGEVHRLVLRTSRHGEAAAVWRWLIERFGGEPVRADLIVVGDPLDVLAASPPDLRNDAQRLAQLVAARSHGGARLGFTALSLNLRYPGHRSVLRSMGPYIASVSLELDHRGGYLAHLSNGSLMPRGPGSGKPEPALTLAMRLDTGERMALEQALGVQLEESDGDG